VVRGAMSGGSPLVALTLAGAALAVRVSSLDEQLAAASAHATASTVVRWP
jgi:hypothetical protein